jgi:hypothetical protein
MDREIFMKLLLKAILAILVAIAATALNVAIIIHHKQLSHPWIYSFCLIWLAVVWFIKAVLCFVKKDKGCSTLKPSYFMKIKK